MRNQQREETLEGTEIMLENLSFLRKHIDLLSWQGDFPGGAVDKNPPADAGNTGLIPGPGRFHMLWSN